MKGQNQNQNQDSQQRVWNSPEKENSKMVLNKIEERGQDLKQSKKIKDDSYFEEQYQQEHKQRLKEKEKWRNLSVKV